MPLSFTSTQGSIIFVIILSSVLIDFIIGVAADYLNLGSIEKSVPSDFKSYYDQDKYEKSQEYLRVCTRFGLITSSFNLAVFLIFWFFKGFPMIDGLVRSWDFDSITTGLLYAAILMFLKGIISLPFAVYSTFVIEEKFGFNKTTPLLFILDILKSIVISGILGGVLLAIILALFEYAGEWAWLICWGAATVFILFVQYIVPTWIMPLFNKFTPLEEGELKTAILGYAQSIKFSINNIFVMDGSKRSTKSNAFFTGFGKNRRIALFDTLIKNHSTDELVAVLAHEMGHFKKKHVIKRMITGILHMGVLFFLVSFFISYQGLFDAFFMEQKSIYASLIFFGLLYSPIDMVLSVIMQFISRKDEYEADRFAVETMGSGQALEKALKKLSVDNLSNLNPHWFYVFLNYSHPPVMDRLSAIRALKN